MSAAPDPVPVLHRTTSHAELLVDGQPFLLRAGELGNSGCSSREDIEANLTKLEGLGLNTVLAPVSWELIEPEEGRFDFGLVTALLEGARARGLRLVLLWFGSFKNSMSCYAPPWIKRDAERFPRARLRDGRPLEILSVFSEANLRADARAFAELLRFLREADREQRTVLLVQVENEVGMLGDARDHAVAATEAFGQPVPQELIEQLRRRGDALGPELLALWQGAGGQSSGTWREVFGESLAADEVFMAWHTARYVDRVAEAGKREWPLPMFVNAALNRPGHEPGRYPSAGPLPHLFDVWQAAAPHIDLLTPDIYDPDFAGWTAKYARPDNPLFIPEAQAGPDCAVHALYAFGRHEALGFSPFSIESIAGEARERLSEAYHLLAAIEPLLTARRGRDALSGVLLDHDQRETTLELGGFRLRALHDFTWEWSPGFGALEPWPRAGGLILALGEGEYLIVGSALLVEFSPSTNDGSAIGLDRVEEGRFDGNRWIPTRRLNGDDTHQGRHVRLPPEAIGMRWVKVYSYR